MKIAAAESIRQAEHRAFEAGVCSSAALMDAVVERLWHALQTCPLTANRQPSRVVVYAGKGNNAGDALGLAARFNCPVTLRSICPPEELSADSRRQMALISAPICCNQPSAEPNLLILDGLLGSGATGPLRAEYAELVQELNHLRANSPKSLTLAIDIPTGLMAEGGPMVQADATAVIGCVKPPMLADGAEDAVGRLIPIPLPEVELPPESNDRVSDAAETATWLPRRANSCFKNRAGRVAIIAGSPGMTGAAQLCAEGALAAGAGLVVLYCLPETWPLLAVRVAPEVMVRCVDSYAEIDEPNAQSLVMGPGLGSPTPENAAALHRLAQEFDGPVVLDADALNLAATQQWSFRENHILTPHPGEMRRLAPQLQLPRRDTARAFLSQHPCTLLLKGARSLIANPQQAYYNSTGGPFMANGGQGDVLSGCIGALAAQGMPPLQAAALGAYACGLAAEMAWAKQGFPPAVRASHVIRHLPAALA